MRPADNRRAEAYAALGIDPAKVRQLTPIASQLRMLGGNLRRRNLPVSPYYYLKCSSSPVARQITELYYSLPKFKRDLIPIEAYCLAASADPLAIFHLIVEACRSISMQSSAIMAAVSHPQVVEATIERALDNEDKHSVRYVEMLHKATGFVPTPSGAKTQITLTQNASASAQAASIPAPPPEQTIRRLANRFNDQRALPADTGSLIIPSVLPHEDLEHGRSAQDAAALIAAHDEDGEEEELTP
jgi:hypothetical protein